LKNKKQIAQKGRRSLREILKKPCHPKRGDAIRRQSGEKEQRALMTIPIKNPKKERIEEKVQKGDEGILGEEIPRKGDRKASKGGGVLLKHQPTPATPMKRRGTPAFKKEKTGLQRQ